jgi:hypothetical protein
MFEAGLAGGLFRVSLHAENLAKPGKVDLLRHIVEDQQ